MQAIARLFRRSVPSLSVERFFAYGVSASGEVEASTLLGVGSADSVEVDMLAFAAFASRVSRVIVAHNHPADTLSPSVADVLLCANMRNMCEAYGSVLVDFLIVTRADCLSFASEGRI